MSPRQALNTNLQPLAYITYMHLLFSFCIYCYNTVCLGLKLQLKESLWHMTIEFLSQLRQILASEIGIHVGMQQSLLRPYKMLHLMDQPGCNIFGQNISIPNLNWFNHYPFFIGIFTNQQICCTNELDQHMHQSKTCCLCIHEPQPS